MNSKTHFEQYSTVLQIQHLYSNGEAQFRFKVERMFGNIFRKEDRKSLFSSTEIQIFTIVRTTARSFWENVRRHESRMVRCCVEQLRFLS